MPSDPQSKTLRRDALAFLALAAFCYADKIILGPLAFVDIYDSIEAHFAHFQAMFKLWMQFGPFSWYPFHAGGVPSFVGQHPPYHPAVLLCGTLPLWAVSLLWNMGQMFLAGYGMSRFLPLLLGVSRRSALVCSAIFAITWISGNVHFVMAYAFPAVFVWTCDLARADLPRPKRLRAAALILLTSLFSFPVLTLPHFPILHLAMVLFLGRGLPNFRRQVAAVFLVWTGYVLLFLPQIASLFLYIPSTQRDWNFQYPGLGPALLDFARWLRNRLGDQHMITLILFGLPLSGRRGLRDCYLFALVMLVVSGLFTSEMKGLFAGTFLIKMDLFMFTTALPVVGVMIAGLVLDQLATRQERLPWWWVVGTVALLPLFGAAHKVLANVCILGAGIAAILLMRRASTPGGKTASRAAVALMVCFAGAGMLIRQQNMTAGMFAPYAQGFSAHQELQNMGVESRHDPFRVACVDVHPVVAQSLGLDTLGGKGPLFNKYYKDIVREAIRPQFKTVAEEKAFDDLWRQIYITRTQVDHDQRGFALVNAPQRSSADFNCNLLRALDVRYLIATKPMRDMDPVASAPIVSPGAESLSVVRHLGWEKSYALPLWAYALEDPLPRVRLADPVVLDDRDAALHALSVATRHEVDTLAYIARQDAPAALASSNAAAPSGPFGRVRIVSWTPDRIVVEGDAPRPCVLLAANNFDPRWSAVFQDGTSIPAFRANHAFQGYRIAHAGPFRLELRFDSPLIWRLHLFSLLGLVLMFWLALIGKATPQAPGCKHLSAEALDHGASDLPQPLSRSLIAGLATSLVWGLAFALFVMTKHRGPQASTLHYALLTIPLIGVLVACWTRWLLRRL